MKVNGKPLKLFIGGQEIAIFSEPLKIPMAKETPDFSKGIEWILEGAEMIDCNERLYSGEFQYYYRRGYKLFFRGGIQKITVELLNNKDLNKVIKDIKFKNMVTLSFTTNGH